MTWWTQYEADLETLRSTAADALASQYEEKLATWKPGRNPVMRSDERPVRAWEPAFRQFKTVYGIAKFIDEVQSQVRVWSRGSKPATDKGIIKVRALFMVLRAKSPV